MTNQRNTNPLIGVHHHDTLEEQDKDVRLHEISLEIDKLIGDNAKKERAYKILGDSFLFMGQYNKARRCFEHRLRVAKKIDDKPEEAKSYETLPVRQWYEEL